MRCPVRDDVRDTALGSNTFQCALKTFLFSKYQSEFPSALEVFHYHALCKFTIDIDTDVKRDLPDSSRPE